MDNLYGVTLEEMGLAINHGFAITITGQKGISFERGNKDIWAIMRDLKQSWQSAQIDKHNCYSDHKIFDNLPDAIKRDWKEDL